MDCRQRQRNVELTAVNKEINFSKSYTYKEFQYITPPEISRGKKTEYPVVIIGAGPIGLTLAIFANKNLQKATKRPFLKIICLNPLTEIRVFER